MIRIIFTSRHINKRPLTTLLLLIDKHIPITAFSRGMACFSLTENTQFGSTILVVIHLGVVSIQAILIVYSKYLVAEGFSFPFAEVITSVWIGSAFNVAKRIW